MPEAISRHAHGKTAANISSTTASFLMNAGVYGLDVHATFGGGNVQLQKLAADGSTWLNVGSAITADGYTAPLYLGSGTYRIQVTTATGVYFQLSRVTERS